MLQSMETSTYRLAVVAICSHLVPVAAMPNHRLADPPGPRLCPAQNAQQHLGQQSRLQMKKQTHKQRRARQQQQQGQQRQSSGLSSVPPAACQLTALMPQVPAVLRAAVRKPR